MGITFEPKVSNSITNKKLLVRLQFSIRFDVVTSYMLQSVVVQKGKTLPPPFYCAPTYLITAEHTGTEADGALPTCIYQPMH